MKLNAVVRDVYGNRLIYIKEQKAAEAVQQLTGKQTISYNDIKSLEVLGVAVEVFDPYKSESLEGVDHARN